MSAKDLSILIPARNEEFLARTIEDILSNIEADTEVIVVLDGEWANPPVLQHKRVNVIYLAEPIGQRAATNLAARLSDAKYLMKVDAHCSFDKGFDRKLIEDMQEDITIVPTMRNLHAFNWVCECGVIRYQDNGETCTCGKKAKKVMVWEPRKGTRNYSYCFDAEPHFQYFQSFSKRPEGQGELTETMSLQGSCFMVTRKKYWELDLSEESFGSWGSQGIEVACKTWLSGGRVLCSHKTWYAHMFRTKQNNGFGFPYPQSGRQIDSAKAKARELFFEGKWGKMVRPLSWLVERFMPVDCLTKENVNIGWTKEALDNLKKLESATIKG